MNARDRTLRHAVHCAVAAAFTLGGCAVGPNYTRPTVQTPPAYKESGAPAVDSRISAQWWQAFDDLTLNDLVQRATQANQTIIAAEAAVSSARALVRVNRAAYFPTVSVSLEHSSGSSRGGGNDGSISNTSGISNTGSISSSGFQGGVGQTRGYSLSAEAAWEPDVWGSVRRSVENSSALASASEADLAGARLTVQADVVTDYFLLRSLDIQLRIVGDTVAAYERAYTITQNRYAAGTVARSDVFQAQTQLANAKADLESLQQQRAQTEHAIAVLVGEPAAQFALQAASDPLPPIPEIGVGVPSALLQRRPDIAGAERRVAAANAGIGVQIATYFPAVTLDGTYRYAATAASALFDPGAGAGVLVASIADTVFDGGARRARVAQARADWQQAQAQYRQTVLAAFQDVEDQIVAVRSLTRQTEQLRQASQAADAAERISLNQYRAGQISFTDVVVTQTTALTARRSLVTAEENRIAALVSLVRALGGGWKQ
jgi:NodT family efflux transporter outer membrane factor (OMF) lipoprotein